VIERLVSDARDLAVVGLKDDRGFACVTVDEIAVKAVVRCIQFAVFEPPVKGGVRVVENLRERTTPVQMLFGKTCPVGFVIVRSFSHERVISVHTVNRGTTCQGNVLCRDIRDRLDGRHSLLA
jgi:hypothetical protein